MQNYIDLVKDILVNGETKPSRAGETISVFGRQLRFDLRAGFPLLTAKHTSFKNILVETLWFISGNCTNTKYLTDRGVNIWNEWAKEDGYTGRIYGCQWRGWRKVNICDFSGVDWQYSEIDQLANVIAQIKANPNDRRLLVLAWNPSEIDEMALPPCHYAFQFGVTNGKLSCLVNMRSSDTFIGLPYNIASYALITHMVAQVCDLQVGELIFCLADTHIYTDHLEAVKQMIQNWEKDPRPLPELEIYPNVKDIDDFTPRDFAIVGYNSHPAIKVNVNV